MVLDVDMDDTATYMKYIAGLNDYIQKELRLFSVGNIDDAQEKASAIEGKLKKTEDRYFRRYSSQERDR